MFEPLAQTADEFAMARLDYIEASKAQDAELALDALVRAVQAADAILIFLGMVDPAECGECDGCKARAAARRAEMEEAIENDPALSVKDNGPLLSEDDEATARRLLAAIFDGVAQLDEDEEDEEGEQ